MFREVIYPECNLVPTNNFMIEIKKISFKRLLQEQYVLLNYLAFQRTAVINGAAGTGKTMIAVEKAKRHAYVGERVLFLCYNALLKDHLVDVNENTFMGNGSMRFYVGASRARIRLDIVTSMNDEQCTHILESVLHYQKKIKNPKKNLSLALNAVPVG